MKELPPKQWRTNKEKTRYICDGDCRSWGLGICTCGLYHHLKGLDLWRLYSRKLAMHESKTIFFLMREGRVERQEECEHSIDLDILCNICKEEKDKAWKSFFKDQEK